MTISCSHMPCRLNLRRFHLRRLIQRILEPDFICVLKTAATACSCAMVFWACSSLHSGFDKLAPELAFWWQLTLAYDGHDGWVFWSGGFSPLAWPRAGAVITDPCLWWWAQWSHRAAMLGTMLLGTHALWNAWSVNRQTGLQRVQVGSAKNVGRRSFTVHGSFHDVWQILELGCTCHMGMRQLHHLHRRQKVFPKKESTTTTAWW